MYCQCTHASSSFLFISRNVPGYIELVGRNFSKKRWDLFIKRLYTKNLPALVPLLKFNYQKVTKPESRRKQNHPVNDFLSDYQNNSYKVINKTPRKNEKKKMYDSQKLYTKIQPIHQKLLKTVLFSKRIENLYIKIHYNAKQAFFSCKNKAFWYFNLWKVERQRTKPGTGSRPTVKVLKNSKYLRSVVISPYRKMIFELKINFIQLRK